MFKFEDKNLLFRLNHFDMDGYATNFVRSVEITTVACYLAGYLGNIFNHIACSEVYLYAYSRYTFTYTYQCDSDTMLSHYLQLNIK